MIYLDCKQIGLDKFEISWGWPKVICEEDPGTDTQSAGCLGIMDKTVTHAIIQYRDGGRVEEDTAERSPYVFEGT